MSTKIETHKTLWEDLHSKGYDVYSGNILFNALFNPHAVNKLMKSDSVLDIGCGNGDVFAWMKNYIREYSAVDISEIACQSLKDRFKDSNQLGSIIPVSGDGTLPFEDKRFDVVFSSLVFQHIHINHVIKYIKEAYRVTKDKSRILIHCTQWKEAKHDTIFLDKESSRDYVTGGMYSHDPETMKNVFADCGFHSFEKYQYTEDILKNIGATWWLYTAQKG